MPNDPVPMIGPSSKCLSEVFRDIDTLFGFGSKTSSAIFPLNEEREIRAIDRCSEDDDACLLFTVDVISRSFLNIFNDDDDYRVSFLRVINKNFCRILRTAAVVYFWNTVHDFIFTNAKAERTGLNSNNIT